MEHTCLEVAYISLSYPACKFRQLWQTVRQVRHDFLVRNEKGRGEMEEKRQGRKCFDLKVATPQPRKEKKKRFYAMIRYAEHNALLHQAIWFIISNNFYALAASPEVQEEEVKANQMPNAKIHSSAKGIGSRVGSGRVGQGRGRGRGRGRGEARQTEEPSNVVHFA